MCIEVIEVKCRKDKLPFNLYFTFIIIYFNVGLYKGMIEVK